MSYSYGKSIVTDGLVFYVDAGNEDSYPGTGTTWSDLVGGNDGSFNNMDDINNPSNNYDSGNGGSIVFDGVDEYVDFGSGLFSFQPNEPLTISCWVKDIGSGNEAIISNMNSSSPYNGWEFGFNQFNWLFFDLEHTWNTSGKGIAIKVEGVSRSGFKNFTVTYDGSSPTTLSDSLNSINFYVDGAVYTTSKAMRNSNADGFSQTSSISYNSKFCIGTRNGLGPFGTWLSGEVNTSCIYNRALSSTEVLQNYNALKNRFI